MVPPLHRRGGVQVVPLLHCGGDLVNDEPVLLLGVLVVAELQKVPDCSGNANLGCQNVPENA